MKQRDVSRNRSKMFPGLRDQAVAPGKCRARRRALSRGQPLGTNQKLSAEVMSQTDPNDIFGCLLGFANFGVAAFHSLLSMQLSIFARRHFFPAVEELIQVSCAVHADHTSDRIEV